MANAKMTLEQEFGSFTARRLRYYQDGIKGGSSADTEAFERMQARFRAVTRLVLSCNRNPRQPSAEQMATAGYRFDEVHAERGRRWHLSRTKCFMLELLEESEDIVAWVAGWSDASGAQVADCNPSIQLTSGRRDKCRKAAAGKGTFSTSARPQGSSGVPAAPMPTVAEVAAAQGKHMHRLTRLAEAQDVFTRRPEERIPPPRAVWV